MMQECPRCKSNLFIKSGIVNQRQRYKCKEYAYHYSVIQKSDTSAENQGNGAIAK